MTRPLQRPRWPEDLTRPEDQAVLEDEAVQAATWMANQAVLELEKAERAASHSEQLTLHSSEQQQASAGLERLGQHLLACLRLARQCCP